MNTTRWFAFVFFIGAVMLLIGAKIGYQSGQIDALNGKLEYHLETNVVKNIIWKKNNSDLQGPNN